jgi:FAD-linked sulfhydryl oxidase
MAAYFPEKPTSEEKWHATVFVSALALLYPCAHCAAALQSYIEEHPPNVESREAFSLWMCGAHNEVNERLGLPMYDCSLAALDERWRTGRDECWGEAGARFRKTSKAAEEAAAKLKRKCTTATAEETLGRAEA